MQTTLEKWFWLLVLGLIPASIIVTHSRLGEEKLPAGRGPHRYSHSIQAAEFRSGAANIAVPAVDTLPATGVDSALSWPADNDADSSGVLAAAFSAFPTSGCAPLKVHFTNEAGGDLIVDRWDFGDGLASSVMNPVHQYTSPGIYTVSLTVTGSAGVITETIADCITVGVRPTAAFAVSPVSGAGPLTVNFTDRSDHAELWFWDFGDGRTSRKQNPTHRYTAAGTYTVKLTTTNACGSNREIKTGLIKVHRCSKPSAEFEGSPVFGSIPLIVNFTDRSIGADSWSWDFGDGGQSTEEAPSHTYRKTGTYTVTLAASNGCGCDQRVKTGYVTVTQTPQTRLHVEAINVSTRSWWIFQRSTAKVRIVDADGLPVEGVAVMGHWSTEVGNVCGFTTGPDGWGSARSGWYNGNGVIAFCVVEAVRPHCTYDFKTNKVTCSDNNDFSNVPHLASDIDIGEIETALNRPLAMNYPNPFNAATEISFFIPEAAQVSMEIYNSVGRRVKNLHDRFVSAGAHSVLWNGTDDSNRTVASGVYFYRITYDGRASISKKMVLMK